MKYDIEDLRLSLATKNGHRIYRDYFLRLDERGTGFVICPKMQVGKIYALSIEGDDDKVFFDVKFR